MNLVIDIMNTKAAFMTVLLICISAAAWIIS